MQDDTLYRYRAEFQRILALLIFLVACGMAVGGWTGGAPWFWFGPIGFALAGSLWLLVVNPERGCWLTHDTLHVTDGGKKSSVALNDVVSMRVQSWSEGPDDIDLILRSGETFPIWGLCGGPGLAEALTKAGVARTE